MAGAWLRWNRLIGTVAVVGFTALAAACGGGATPVPNTSGPGVSGSGPAPLPTPSSSAPENLPLAFSSFGAVCDGTPVPDAPAYTGPGPHPVLFYTVPVQNDPYQLGVIAAEPNAWEVNDASTVQLVACVASSAGAAATTCDYGFGGLPPEVMTLNWGEYTITLYAARTAKPVTTVQVQGADDSCPSSIPAPTGDAGPPPQSTDLTADQLTQVLGSYIN